MQRIPEEDARTSGADHGPAADGSEMDGLIGLGMKDEALRLARRNLKQNAITAWAFNESLNAILTLADRTKPWAKAVESAYERLARRELPAVRFLMLSFRNACDNHEGVLRLMPKRFAGEFAPLELTAALEAAFELGRIEIMEELAARLPRAIREAQHPMMQSQLLLCLAEYLARKGRWDAIIDVLEAVQADETFSQNAVKRIVEVHIVRALLALRQGFQLIQQFNRSFDPAAELTVPGNDKGVQEEAGKGFRRLQKTLERIVPEKRQRELGLLARM